MKNYYFCPIRRGHNQWQVVVVKKEQWDSRKYLPSGDPLIREQMFSKGFLETEDSIFVLRVKSSLKNLAKICENIGMTLNKEIENLF